MSEKRKRYILPEEEIPHYWYNIQADMVNKPMPPLHPGTKQPLKAEDLYPIFAKELCHQELNQTDAWIEIPEDLPGARLPQRKSAGSSASSRRSRRNACCRRKRCAGSKRG